METGGNSPPAPSKTPEPMVTKLGMGDDVGDPYPCAKFHHDPIRGFCTPPQRPSARASAYNVTRLVSFFGGCFLLSTAKTPTPIFTINTSNDVVSRKDVPFGGLENKILHFDPPFPQKTANFGQILMGLRLEIFGSKRL